MTSFDSYYEEEIAPLLPDMEKQRKKLSELGRGRLKAFNIFVTIIAGAGSIYAGIVFSSFMVFFMAAFSILIAMVLFQDQLKAAFLSKDGLPKLKGLYKSQVIGKVVSFFGSEWRYEPYGKLSVAQLGESHLFHIGRYTKVETDDIIEGSWKGCDILIANVKTTSTKEIDPARLKNASFQSYNGLFIRLKKKIAGNAFLIPKAKTAAGVGGLAGMKFSRDPNMTMEEQKAHNLAAMGQGIGGYYWDTKMTSLSASLSKQEIREKDQKEYDLYTSSNALLDELSNNSKLQSLMSKAFVDQGAINELTKASSFQILDNHLMDQVVQSTLTYAIHSDHIWVLVPAFEEKFELSLNRPINKDTVAKTHRDIQLALTSLAPFVD